MRTGAEQVPESGPDVPAELELGDGSRLVLEDSAEPPSPRRLEGSAPISLEDAMSMSGQPFAGYRRLKS